MNAAADTGNTALHAVANTGNVPQAEALLKSSSLIIDPTNPQCENATPLHLAIMHGKSACYIHTHLFESHNLHHLTQDLQKSLNLI